MSGIVTIYFWGDRSHRTVFSKNILHKANMSQHFDEHGFIITRMWLQATNTGASQ